MESYFATLPLEVVVDLLSVLDKRSVAQFASVSKNQKYYFEKQDGLWKQLVCKLFRWGSKELSKVQKGSKIDWAREYRVSAYYNEKIRNNQIYADPTQTQFKYFSVVDEATKHYKFDDKDIEDTQGIPFFYFDIQSKIPLYPLPIGNFSVAYYEVENIDSDPSLLGYLYVGGALDGFVNGLPGVGRNSYSYCVYDGRIVLEDDFGMSTVPECTSGDVAGFGIDFSTNSIFFTKNGKIVAEATKTSTGTPLLNLKSLHATIGFCATKECKVNLGADPFKFDVLKYQQEKAKTKLYSVTKFYSDVLREHLTAFSESETSALVNELSVTYAPMDYNLPPAGARLNSFLYMLLYMRIPPNYVPPSDFDVQVNGLPNALTAMAHCRAITHANSLLPSLENSLARSIIDYMARSLEVEQKEMPYLEYCQEITYKALETLGAIFQILVAASVDDLVKDFGCFHSYLALSYVFLGGWENTYYLAQMAARAFYQPTDPLLKNNNQELTMEKLQEAYSVAVHKIIYLRRTAIIISAAEKMRLKFIPQRKEEKAEAMRVYGNDKILESLFDSSVKRMANLEVNTYSPPRSSVILTLITEAKSGNTNQLITYGVYAFRLPVNNFATKGALAAEILQRLNELVTDEMKREFLEDTLKMLLDPSTIDESALAKSLEVAQVIFGYQMKIKKNVQELLQETEEFLRNKVKKYERKIKKQQRETALATAQSKASSRTILIGASLAMAAAVFVSALIYMRKKTK